MENLAYKQSLENLNLVKRETRHLNKIKKIVNASIDSLVMTPNLTMLSFSSELSDTEKLRLINLGFKIEMNVAEFKGGLNDLFLAFYDKIRNKYKHVSMTDISIDDDSTISIEAEKPYHLFLIKLETIFS